MADKIFGTGDSLLTQVKWKHTWKLDFHGTNQAVTGCQWITQF